MTITYHAGRRIQGLSTDNAITSGLSAWTPVTFNNSTIVNGMSATGNVLSSANVTGSWASYIRSNEYISPSTGGGEFYFTGQSQPPSLAIGFEKSPFNEYPSAVYQNANFGWHVTSGDAGNDIYEKTSLYNITPVITDSSVSKITMDSAGLVKYYVDDVLVRTSTVTASGNYYINASFSGASADTASVYIKTPVSASLTNVQAGSRFEETDTRKIYYSSKVHTFLLADTGTSFTPSASGNVEYLVIGGGGGGGATVLGGLGTGGGGAGGYRTASGFPVTAQAYTITVGAGGAGGITDTSGSQGNNSIFSTITSDGGGYGGGYNGLPAGGSGGSGGGGYISGGTATSGQGSNGGITVNSSPNYGGGGGGGKNATGSNGTGAGGGNGGDGLSSSITGSAITRAGGGGGGYIFSGGANSSGGSGGGGGNGVAGTANTGGGGGGHAGLSGNGFAGGSGIVIIKYSSGVNATGGTITTVWTEEA